MRIKQSPCTGSWYLLLRKICFAFSLTCGEFSEERMIASLDL